MKTKRRRNPKDTQRRRVKGEGAARVCSWFWFLGWQRRRPRRRKEALGRVGRGIGGKTRPGETSSFLPSRASCTHTHSPTLYLRHTRTDNTGNSNHGPVPSGRRGRPARIHRLPQAYR